MLEAKTVTGEEQENDGIVRISQEGDQQGVLGAETCRRLQEERV